jgi:hypothetical protein
VNTIYLQHIGQQYPKNFFLAGSHKVVVVVGEVIRVALDAAKWTKVMDGQWEIQPAKPMVRTIKVNELFNHFLLFYR